MARQETVQPAVDKGAALTDMDQLNNDVAVIDKRHSELQVINEQFGDSLPYDKTRIENEAKFYLNQSASAMLEAGKRFTLLKEYENHGDFTACLERIGVEPRTARNMMKAALKFSDKKETVSVLGSGKLYALMSEEDEKLDALENGGTIAGLTLDAIDRMSGAELKKALREAKQEKEATELIIEQKDKKINELDREEQRKQLMKGDELYQELEKKLHGETMVLLGHLRVVNKVIAEIQELGNDAPSHLRGATYQTIERARDSLREIEVNNNVQAFELDDDDLNDKGQPVWMED